VGGSLGDLNAANRYTYAGDNPINAVDPSGEQSIPCWLSIPIDAFELFGAAYGIGAVTIVGLPAAVGAYLSGPITAGAGIAIGLGITFIHLRIYCDCWSLHHCTECRSNNRLYSVA
jgi:hypothetical protein